MADITGTSEPEITWDPDEPFDPEAIYECDECHANIATDGELCEECHAAFIDHCMRHFYRRE